MIEALMVTWSVISPVLAEVTNPSSPPTPTLVLDILDLQWWQILVGIIGVLGLSPAPWILGLATGKIQFTSVADEAHKRELAARKEGWEDEKTALIAYHQGLMGAEKLRYSDLQLANERNIEVAEQQRERADAMTSALAQSTEALENTNHILTELTSAAREVTPSGPSA